MHECFSYSENKDQRSRNEEKKKIEKKTKSLSDYKGRKLNYKIIVIRKKKRKEIITRIKITTTSHCQRLIYN